MVVNTLKLSYCNSLWYCRPHWGEVEWLSEGACFGKCKTIGLARASCGNDCGHGSEELEQWAYHQFHLTSMKVFSTFQTIYTLFRINMKNMAVILHFGNFSSCFLWKLWSKKVSFLFERVLLTQVCGDTHAHTHSQPPTHQLWSLWSKEFSLGERKWSLDTHTYTHMHPQHWSSKG